MALAAYLDQQKLEYGWLDGVEDATFQPLTVGRDAIGSSYAVKVLQEPQSVAPYGGGSTFETTPEDMTIYFWEAGSGAPTPVNADKITIETVDWVVVSVDYRWHGNWKLRLRKAVS